MKPSNQSMKPTQPLVLRLRRNREFCFKWLGWLISFSLGKQERSTSMPSKKIDFDVVREISLALPGVEESTLHGAPSLKVSGRMLTCPALHKSAEPNSLMVRIGFEQRADLLAAEPLRYYITDHYVEHPSVLVRLSEIDRESLRDLLRASWEFVTSHIKTRKGTAR
jgi:hypothetical protein